MFYDLCNRFSDVFIKMKQNALDYNDPWKIFKLKLLSQVDYFENVPNTREFFNEIQYSMKEEFFEEGTEVICSNEQCK